MKQVLSLTCMLSALSCAMDLHHHATALELLTPEITHALLWSYNDPIATVAAIKSLRQTSKECAARVPTLWHADDLAYIARSTQSDPLEIAFIAHTQAAHALRGRVEQSFTPDERKAQARRYSALLAQLFGHVPAARLSRALGTLVRKYDLTESDFNQLHTVHRDVNHITYRVTNDEQTTLEIGGLVREEDTALHGAFVSPYVRYIILDDMTLSRQWTAEDGIDSAVIDSAITTVQAGIETFKERHQFWDVNAHLLAFCTFYDTIEQAWVFLFWDDARTAHMSSVSDRFTPIVTREPVPLCDGFQPIELRTRASDGAVVLYLQSMLIPNRYRLIAYHKGRFIS